MLQPDNRGVRRLFGVRRVLAQVVGAMKSLEGKVLTAFDGRQGYCISSRPKDGRIRVIVIGRERKIESWGQADVPIDELLHALGLKKKPAAPKAGEAP